MYRDPTGKTFHDVIWASDRFIAVGESGYVLSSHDGRAWTSESFGFGYRNVAWVGDRFVAVGSSGIVSSSSDGRSWQHHWTGGRDDVGMDLAWSGSRWVISGQGGLVSSADFGSWPAPPRSVTGTCPGIVWTGSLFAAACNSAAYVSPDGVRFEHHFPGTTSDIWSDIAWTGSELVVVGARGVVAASSDGVSWTRGSSGTTAALNSVTWGQGRLVAVGSAGTVLTSLDGLSWQAVESGSTAALTNVRWTGDRFVAAGDSATLIASSDGTSWSELELPERTSGSLDGAAASPEQLVVVGANGRILRLPAR